MKKHKSQKKYVKVESSFLREILHLLAEADDYLDRDFAWEKTDEISADIKKVIDKASDLAYPVRPY
jgi:hypothetical protein